MTSAVLGMLPFALAGAFLPTWTRDVVLLLATGRPIENALSYVAGNAVYRFVFGLAVLFVLDAAQVSRLAGAGVPPWVALAAGAGLAVLGVWLVATCPREPPEGLPAWLRRFERVPPPVCFGLAMAFVASPGVQYVYFLAGMRVLSDARLPVPQTVALLTGYVALLQAMLLAPVAVYLLARDRAVVVLERFRAWLGRDGQRLGGIMLLALGLYVAVRSGAVILRTAG